MTKLFKIVDKFCNTGVDIKVRSIWLKAVKQIREKIGRQVYNVVWEEVYCPSVSIIDDSIATTISTNIKSQLLNKRNTA